MIGPCPATWPTTSCWLSSSTGAELNRFWGRSSCGVEAIGTIEPLFIYHPSHISPGTVAVHPEDTTSINRLYEGILGTKLDAAHLLTIPGPEEPWHTGSMLGLDLDTTGPNPHDARVVTASIVLLDAAGQMRANAEWLVDPEIDIPAEAAAVHGVTTEHAQTHGMDAATALSEIVATLKDFMQHRVPIVAYNGVYDFMVLATELARRNMAELAVAGVVDPFVLDKQADTYRKGKRTLAVVSEHYEVVLDNAHTSQADSIAAVQVCQAIVTRFPDHFNVPLEQLFTQQIQWKADQAASFEQYLRRRNPEAFVSRDWPVEKLR